MTEREGGRHCAECDRVVHDVSRMTEAAVRALGAQRGQRKVCVRYTLRDDGSVHTAPRPLGPPSRLGAHVRPLVVMAATTLAAACASEPAPAPVVVQEPVEPALAPPEAPANPAETTQPGEPPTFSDAFETSVHTSAEAPDKHRERAPKGRGLTVLGEWF
jgi:hypothetical protein